MKDLYVHFKSNPAHLSHDIGFHVIALRHYVAILIAKDVLHLDKTLAIFNYGPNDGFTKFSDLISHRYGEKAQLVIQYDKDGYNGP